MSEIRILPKELDKQNKGKVAYVMTQEELKLLRQGLSELTKGKEVYLGFIMNMEHQLKEYYDELAEMEANSHDPING